MYANIELFVKLVSEDFKKIPTRLRHDNLTREQRRALNELKSLRGVVIKPADKGGNVVVWPTTLYEKEAMRQLRDTTCYRRLSFNPTSVFQAELCEILEDAFQQGFISKEIKEGLIPASPRTPCLYLLPKVHKDLVSPPGRPIVSGNGSLNEMTAHPKALKNSIPVGQFMRTRRVCSDEASFVEQAQDLATRFEERGYSERAIRHGWRRASRMSRNDLLHSARKRTSSTQVRFISTFNNNIHG
ncbi:uncharacterized protein [Dendrobates tinctorius]|uniref:uncharacterized protein isoform X3 n=1 Tax=Dendrobates tinctorius TaxID=92724 RepID=UPI003CC94FBD